MALPGRLVLLGHPVSHSLSPRFQNAALAAAGIALDYVAIDVAPAALAATVSALVGDRAAGNVTIPHKADMVPLCDRLTDAARRANAVNTFRVRDGGVLEGHNTDIAGFQQLALSVCPVPTALRSAAVLGAGGAAAAVLAALEGWRIPEIRLYNRTMDRALTLANRYRAVTVSASPREAAAGAELVVNATALGLAGDDVPLAIGDLSPGAAVLDLVYRPGGTALVRAARTAGLAAADGMEMLLEQGAQSFEYCLGVAAPRNAMRAALAGAS